MRNELFEILFDTLTPRSHFIIKFNNNLKNKHYKRNLKDLDDYEMILMLKLIDHFFETYNLNRENFILSFHTGCWVKIFSKFSKKYDILKKKFQRHRPSIFTVTCVHIRIRIWTW
jgi:hypothetical protein